MIIFKCTVYYLAIIISVISSFLPEWSFTNNHVPLPSHKLTCTISQSCDIHCHQFYTRFQSFIGSVVDTVKVTILHRTDVQIIIICHNIMNIIVILTADIQP